jgi:Ala-tRNA(Pro) deacylase
MSASEATRIKDTFERLSIQPTYLEHEPVKTSAEAAAARGFELRQGIKALLFTNGEGDWVVVDLPADRRVDEKKVAAEMGWSKRSIRMATPEEVTEVTGCEIGSVPPFGHKNNIPILVDSGVYENEESGFNIGLLTESVKVPTQHMRVVFKDVGATEGEFSK